ncbi:YoaK family small membrane protein [Serratia marcescens]
MPAVAWIMSSKVENKMKIGYLFPVAIIVAAVVLLAWFIIGGYAMPSR